MFHTPSIPGSGKAGDRIRLDRMPGWRKNRKLLEEQEKPDVPPLEPLEKETKPDVNLPGERISIRKEGE